MTIREHTIREYTIGDLRVVYTWGRDEEKGDKLIIVFRNLKGEGEVGYESILRERCGRVWMCKSKPFNVLAHINGTEFIHIDAAGVHRISLNVRVDYMCVRSKQVCIRTNGLIVPLKKIISNNVNEKCDISDEKYDISDEKCDISDENYDIASNIVDKN